MPWPAMAKALALVLLPLLASGTATETTRGVQKVIQMLTDMTAKAKAEKKDEQAAFARFESWCGAEAVSLDGDVKKAAEQIELLSTEIGKLGSDAERLGGEISKLQSDTDGFEKDFKSEKEQRDKERAEFEATENEFSQSLDALERAIASLSNKDEPDNSGAAAALLQVKSVEAQSIAEAFLGGAAREGEGSPLGGMDNAAPEAHVYENQSGGVIGILKKLQDQFRNKIDAARKEEMNSKHAYDLVAQDLSDSIANAKRDAEEKTAEKMRKSGKKAMQGKQLQATKTGKATDEKTLKEMKTECEEKTLSFQDKQQMRAEELEAIAKAIEVLKSPDVLGSDNKHFALAQDSSARSLIQGGRSLATAKTQGVHHRLHEFLSMQGRKLHSKQLTLLAEKVTSGPFDKIVKMIEASITRLLKNAAEESEHEGFCDSEMAKSKGTRDKLTAQADSLKAAIEDGKATVMNLATDTKDLSQEIDALNKALGEAKELRNDEHKKNTETIAESQAAQAGVAKAMEVLKAFYEKAAMSSLLQAKARPQGGVKMGTDAWKALANPLVEEAGPKQHQDGMATFGEESQGQQDAASGVLGMLEVLMSDFARLEAETTSGEEVASKTHRRFLTDSHRTLEVKKEKVEMNNADRVDAETKMQENTADLETTNDQLSAAEKYYKKLVPQCVDQGVSEKKRNEDRQKELDALKEAMEILRQQRLE